MQSTPSQLFSIEARLPKEYEDISYDIDANGDHVIDKLIKKETYTISKDTISLFKTKSSSEKEVKKEFSILKSITDEEDNHHDSLKKSNDGKNRYSDIKPYSHNTVNISSKQYINASFVHFPTTKKFIATQGPLDSTGEDFWQMVYDYDVKMIIMLCGLTENGRSKCSEYWSDSNSKTFKIILVEEKKISSNIKTRTFQLIKDKNEAKTITQLHFLGWPDHGVPEISAVYDTFIDMIDKINELGKSDKNPIIVHCSAGVGRTGTFIAMYTLYCEIMDKKSFCVWNLVRKMKECRLFLVENILQYMFIFSFVSTLLSKVIK